jgi:hypothetical protein
MPRTALHNAASEGDAALVRQLVAEGRKERLQSAAAGEPCPLPWPAGGGTTTLIAANVQDALGRSPVHIACAKGSLPAFEALLEANGNAALRDKRGRTPLMEAASHGHIAVVRAILQLNRDPTAQVAAASATDSSGWTALHSACFNGDVAMVQLLLGPPIDWGRGPPLLKLGEATDLGETAKWSAETGQRVGLTPRGLAARHDQHSATQAVDVWLEELEARRREMLIKLRAMTVASLQRLALSTTLHRMVEASLHSRRLFLPADWRPTDQVLAAVAARMPVRAPDAVVQRYLEGDKGWAWRTMQERRITRVHLYCTKTLAEDGEADPAWKADDPHSTFHVPGVSQLELMSRSR